GGSGQVQGLQQVYGGAELGQRFLRWSGGFI
ncbi:MAG: hypothetical protein QOH14_1500, partial [Pseudonocardiales bacterium]|nr:hypothetical protein [Pseudonocardiales bacterium]